MEEWEWLFIVAMILAVLTAIAGIWFYYNRQKAKNNISKGGVVIVTKGCMNKQLEREDDNPNITAYIRKHQHSPYEKPHIHAQIYQEDISPSELHTHTSTPMYPSVPPKSYDSSQVITE